MENEKNRILKMVEAGKLSADEAFKLMDAMNNPAPMEVIGKETTSKARFLKIRVFDKNRQKAKVNITLPLFLVRGLSKLIPHSAQVQLNEKNINLEQIMSLIDQAAGTKLIEVDDDDENERVEIFIE